MPVTYTNHKGRTYHLCRRKTKTGKPQYYFAREPKGEPVEEIPEGWEIRESPNGIVSLAKKESKEILPEESESVEAVVERHPKSHNYRVYVRSDRIEVYERVGAETDELIDKLEDTGLLVVSSDRVREMLERRARYTPVLRFILHDEEDRTFKIERMSYRGEGGWKNVHRYGPLDTLACEIVPKLGTDALFELHLP